MYLGGLSYIGLFSLGIMIDIDFFEVGKPIYKINVSICNINNISNTVGIYH